MRDDRSHFCRAGAASPRETPAITPLLVSIAKHTRAIVQAKLRELGFFNGQDEVLFALRDGHVAGMSELSSTMNVRPAAMTRTVEALVGRGLLERLRSTDDARRRNVRITDSGLAATLPIMEMREVLEGVLRVGTSDDEALRMRLVAMDRLVTSRLARLR